MSQIDDELDQLERKLGRLRLDYERYFLGTRPREPVIERGDVNKIILVFSNQSIQNTAARFRFNSLNSRYQAYRRQWDNILRQMEAGTYKRDVFKANIRQKHAEEQQEPVRAGAGREAADDAARSSGAGEKLFERYVTAAKECGQQVKGLTPQKLQGVIDKQTSALRERLGCADVSFRVVVQEGRVKLKAGPVKS